MEIERSGDGFSHSFTFSFAAGDNLNAFQNESTIRHGEDMSLNHSISTCDLGHGKNLLTFLVLP